MAGIVDIQCVGADKLAGFNLNFGKKGDEKVCRAVANAINETLTHSRKVSWELIKKIYAVKAQDFKAGVRIIKANSKRLSGQLDFSGTDNIPLVSFPHSITKNYISVQVLKAGGRKKIQAGGSKKILETKKKKRAAVFKVKGKIRARTEVEAYPVVLFGPSFMAFFKKPEKVEFIRSDADAWFEKELAHSLAHMDLIAANAARKAAKGKK